jgi:hypothetical protein
MAEGEQPRAPSAGYSRNVLESIKGYKKSRPVLTDRLWT